MRFGLVRKQLCLKPEDKMEGGILSLLRSFHIPIQYGGYLSYSDASQINPRASAYNVTKVNLCLMI
jgi:hypothetical protein